MAVTRPPKAPSRWTTNVARRGHPRMVPHSKMSSKGRTELQISLPGAKHVEEAAGDVRFSVFPQKTSENAKKQIFSLKFSKIFRTRPNASERIQMHPNESERIRMHLNRSEQVRASPKTSKNLRKPRKHCETIAKVSRKFSRALVYSYSPRYWWRIVQPLTT